jgi:hypothetical protein
MFKGLFDYLDFWKYFGINHRFNQDSNYYFYQIFLISTDLISNHFFRKLEIFIKRLKINL